MTDRFLVAGCTPWARRVFDKTLLPREKTHDENWFYVESPDGLKVWEDAAFPATYIFFLHWRWMVRKEITSRGNAIGFHLGRLPSERGGTPLQWRILEGSESATLTMFRMTETVDGGAVLNEDTVGLHGSGEAVFARAMGQAAYLIEVFLQDPAMYEGRDWTHTDEPTRVYPRRTPEESRIPTDNGDLEVTYDRIRATDVEGYPKAFIKYGALRFEFSQAVMYDGKMRANVEITEVGK